MFPKAAAAVQDEASLDILQHNSRGATRKQQTHDKGVLTRHSEAQRHCPPVPTCSNREFRRETDGCRLAQTEQGSGIGSYSSDPFSEQRALLLA